MINWPQSALRKTRRTPYQKYTNLSSCNLGIRSKEIADCSADLPLDVQRFFIKAKGLVVSPYLRPARVLISYNRWDAFGTVFYFHFTAAVFAIQSRRHDAAQIA